MKDLAAELGALADQVVDGRRTKSGYSEAPFVSDVVAQKLAVGIKSLLARLGELEAERAETYATMNHAHIFICTREKMHPDGRLLYEDLLRRLAPSPKPEE